MSDHVNTPPPPPTQFYPYIPKGVVNAVLKALAKDPNERFQTTRNSARPWRIRSRPPGLPRPRRLRRLRQELPPRRR